jgi:N-carbamoylputrescine amidase
VKISVCQLPDELSTDDLAWKRFAQRIGRERPDVVLMNEMPFGPWVAREQAFDAHLAAISIGAHEAALTTLATLPGAVVSSRPVGNNGRLANEGFLMAEGEYRAVHHKQYFPREPGFFESAWFAAGRSGFEAFEHRGVRFGVLLCTELMFTEWARHYRRQGAHVILVPRASETSMRTWDAAARMAAIVSGCYVLSSNRVSRTGSEPRFGGRGFAYSPAGELMGETSEAVPLVCVDIDQALVVEAQRQFPCYVHELGV